MSIFENLMSRLGKNRVDPMEREMKLHARAAAPMQLSPAIALPELMAAPPSPPRRAAHGTTPPPIPPRRQKRH